MWCYLALLAQFVKETGEARSTQTGRNSSHDPFLLYFRVQKTNRDTTEHLSTAEIPVKLGGLDTREVLF